MHDFSFGKLDRDCISVWVTRASELAHKHQLVVGAVEMAAGATLLAKALASGEILLDQHVLASRLPAISAFGLGTVGGVAAKLVGGIGIAAMGTAFAVPSVVLATGAAAVSSLLGRALGEVAEAFLQPDLLELALAGNVALIGVALLVDGARRILGDERMRWIGVTFNPSGLSLKTFAGKVCARSLEELRKVEPSAVIVSSAAGTATAAAASCLAAANVTVAGSSTLGGAAVALGLASPPLWPVVAAAATGAGVGYVAWRVAHRLPGSERLTRLSKSMVKRG